MQKQQQNKLTLKPLVAAMAFALAASVQAADAGKKNRTGDAAESRVVELGAMTVTAGRGSSFEDMDMSTTVMTREQVMQAPETTVDQIVNKIPGVFASQRPANQLHPTSQVFSIRGFGTTTNVNTLVMVDGIPINDPYFRTIDWAQVPKDSVERIEVIRGGGATSMWGNLAMGGIVNIVTREPMPDEKRINVSYGSFNTRTANVAATLVSSDQLKIGISFGETLSDGYNTTPTEYRNSRMTSSSSQAGNATLSAYYSPSKDSKYYLKIGGHKIKESGQVWDITSNSWEKYQIAGGGSTKLAGGGSVNMNGWYNKGEMDTANANTTPAFSILQPSAAVTPYLSQIEQVKYSSAGGSFFYQNNFGNIKDVKIGIDLRRITADDNNNFYSATAPTARIIARAEHRFQGIFAQGTYRPTGVPLDITVGLRQDFFQTDGGNVTNQVGGVSTTNMLSNQSYTQFDPRLGAKYYFENGFDVRAAAYRNFAAPGMNQMYRSTQSGTNYLAPNASLTPQDNFGREIGFDFIRPGFDVALTFFHNKLKNYIDYAPVCATVIAGSCDGHAAIAGTGFDTGRLKGINQYVNAGDAVLKGAELLVNWQATQTVQFNGGFTKTSAYLVRSAYGTGNPAPAPVDTQLGQVPTWMATLGSTWQATPKFAMSLQLKSFPEFWNNTAHTQRNGAATLADVGVIYKASKMIDIYGSAQNIGGKSYYDQGLTYTTKEGSTSTTGGIPALGMPFNLTVGIRASF